MYGFTVMGMVIFGIGYGCLRENHKKYGLLCKALGTGMAVFVGGIGAVQAQSLYGWLVFVSLVLCMIADVVLELDFIKGILVFGAAHIGLIAAFWMQAAPHWYTFLLTAGLYLSVLVFFRKKISGLGDMKLPALCYMAILSFMVSMAFTVWEVLSTANSIILFAGAFSFIVSDCLIAYQTVFEKRVRLIGILLMVLYYGAVYLIALSLLWGLA